MYLYGPAVDQLLAQENVGKDLLDAERVYWMLTDNLGTVRDIVDNHGALIEHYRYDAYGNLLEGDTSLTRYLYTAREFDADTGLQYNRHRWYDPATGRWLSEDPIKDGSNWYEYVGNSPTNGRDPWGLWSENYLIPRSSLPRRGPGNCLTPSPVTPFCPTDEFGWLAEAGATVGSVFVEPLDWGLSAWEIWNDPWSLWSYVGFVPLVPAAVGKFGRAADDALYAVGTANDLRKAPLEGTSVHHVPQSREAESLIGDFNVRNRVGNEPAIRLPNSEHGAVTAAQALRTAPASARDLLADDIRLLRRYTSAPKSSLRRLIDATKDAHLHDFKPIHRPRGVQ